MSTPQHPTPEDQGIPDHADDTSTAFSEADRPRFNDSPQPMPADQPQALDEHGLTGVEAREGEPLEQRLAREEPDFGSPVRENARMDPAAEPAVRELPEEVAPVSAGPEDGDDRSRMPDLEPPELATPEVEPPEIDMPEAEPPDGGDAPELDLPEIDRTPEGGMPEGEFPDRP